MLQLEMTNPVTQTKNELENLGDIFLPDHNNVIPKRVLIKGIDIKAMLYLSYQKFSFL